MCIYLSLAFLYFYMYNIYERVYKHVYMNNYICCLVNAK